jgi:hypothetical protein
MDSAITADSLALDPALEEASQPYIGRWNRLVSTTNWEKGRIISQWRDALADAGAPAAQYSDEAWSRLVGGVTGQHVGRLRRVYQRFGQAYMQYGGLYWSHFQAALDWTDAEMWHEGAVQSLWSVSQMRHQRWETLGGTPDAAPRDEDAVTGELDEDFEPAQTREPEPRGITGSTAEVEGPLREGPDFGEEDERDGRTSDRSLDAAESPASSSDVEFVQPFANLAELPDDLAEAFESYKLAILRHKAQKWEQISLADVLGSLDALKQLALAPSQE